MQIELKRPAGVKLLTGGKLCPADLIVTPVLQHKTVTENGMVTPDAGFAGLSGVQVSVAGGGACDRPHIIQVDTLPTEHMDETAVYLCGGAYYQYNSGQYDVLICSEGQNLEEAYDELQEYSFVAILESVGLLVTSYHYADTMPTEDFIESSEEAGLAVYYIADQNNLFVYIEGAWISLSEAGMFQFPFIGAINDPSESTKWGYYFVNGTGWTKYLSPVGTLAITTNGMHDVSGFAQAQVEVAPVLQEKTARANGTVTPDSGYDGLSRVTVNVPVPEGYVRPSGTKEITENGTYDVSNYAGATVNVERTAGGGIVLHPVAQPTIQLGTNITAGAITGMNATVTLQPISNLTITEGE